MLLNTIDCFFFFFSKSKPEDRKEFLEREMTKLVYKHTFTEYCGNWTHLGVTPILCSKIRSRLSEIIHFGGSGIKR